MSEYIEPKKPCPKCGSNKIKVLNYKIERIGKTRIPMKSTDKTKSSQAKKKLELKVETGTATQSEKQLLKKMEGGRQIAIEKGEIQPPTPHEQYVENLGIGSPVGGSPNKPQLKQTSSSPSPPIQPQPQQSPPPQKTQQTQSPKSVQTPISSQPLKECPNCTAPLGPKAKICWRCGYDLRAEPTETLGKMRELVKTKGEEGKELGFTGAFKETLKERAEKKGFEDLSLKGIGKGISTNIKAKGIETLFTGFDKLTGKFGQKFGETKEQVKNVLMKSLHFSIVMAILPQCILGLLIPSISPFVMAFTGVPLNIPGMAWYAAKSGAITYIVLAAVFGVSLPFSLIAGKQFGWDLSGINNILTLIVATSASAWGATNILLPALQTRMPAEYAMMMCLVKYKGNMQICVAPGNQTVQYEKVGTYETVILELGAVTPSKSIPPMNPVPGMWKQYPYTLPFTLKNENSEGSPYYINVTSITAYASSTGKLFNESGPVTPSRLNLKPSGSYVASARFSENKQICFLTDHCCDQYTYFQINVTTEQIGGGSSKFAIIDNDEGFDNQNFMYFFDPDVKAETGPLDIYTYTLPFTIPMNQVNIWQTTCSDGLCEPAFMIFIQITNKGDGLAAIKSLKLIQTTDKINLSHYGVSVSDKKCGCTAIVHSGENVTTVNVSKCYTHNITFEPFSLIQNGNAMITCKGWFDDTTFIGKSTQFISVDADYDYTQSFSHQIACYKMSPEQESALCVGTTEETCESASGSGLCVFCRGDGVPDDKCSNPPCNCDGLYKAHNNIGQCVVGWSACDYKCDPVCGAECGYEGEGSECTVEEGGFNCFRCDCQAVQREGFECLEEGSLILTPNGFKKIEDLKKGDYVIGYKDGKRVESKILETAVHQGEFELYFYKGYWFTGNHLVYLDDYKDFKPILELSNVIEHYEGKIYNIQTETKNYFGENGLLIHNK